MAMSMGRLGSKKRSTRSALAGGCWTSRASKPSASARSRSASMMSLLQVRCRATTMVHRKDHNPVSRSLQISNHWSLISHSAPRRAWCCKGSAESARAGDARLASSACHWAIAAVRKVGEQLEVALLGVDEVHQALLVARVAAPRGEGQGTDGTLLARQLLAVEQVEECHKGSAIPPGRRSPQSRRLPTAQAGNQPADGVDRVVTGELAGLDAPAQRGQIVDAESSTQAISE